MLFNMVQCTGCPPPPAPTKNDLALTVINSKVKRSAFEDPGNLPEETGQRVSNRWRYSRWEVRTVYPVKVVEPRGWPPFSYSYERHQENQLGTGLNCAFHVPTVGSGEGLGFTREVLHPPPSLPVVKHQHPLCARLVPNIV